MPEPSSHRHFEQLEILISELREFVVTLVSVDGRFTSWHPGILQLFGYERDEWIGQPVDIPYPEPDRSRGDAGRELATAAKEGRASDTRTLVNKAGQALFVEGVTIALHNAAGELLGYGKVLRDVTEQQSAQEGLRVVGRALDQSIVIVRQWNGVIDHWTSGCEQLYGWTAQEAVGRPIQELLQTKYPGPFEQIQSQLQAYGTWKGEVEHTRRDGSPLSVSTYWALLNDSEDEPLTVIETHIDVTPRLQIQRELEDVNKRLQLMARELERSNQELEEFARIASHDLSAPITSTRWLADLLMLKQGEKLDDTGRHILRQIVQGLGRMSELVDAVLAHARVGTTAIGSTEEFSAAEALDVAIANLQRHVEESGARIERDELPAVNIDKHALTQLFQNLLSNAIKYRRPNVAPAIRINAEWNDGMWRFAVQDNGIGIEREWHTRIFQPMQRRHGLDIAGSGIGLATCKKIVTRVGGDIWVESELDAGSTFFFTLPGSAPQSS